MTETDEKKDGKPAHACEFCSKTYDSKRSLANHVRHCPSNPENIKEPEIEAATPETGAILDELDIPPELIKLMDKPDLDGRIKQLSEELGKLLQAKKAVVEVDTKKEHKIRQMYKEMGYKGAPVIFGDYKRTILVSLDYIAPTLNIESQSGEWEPIPEYTGISPNGAVYLLFKRK
jgi:hypothetical protein